MIFEVFTHHVFVFAKETFVDLSFRFVSKPGVVTWVIDDTSLAAPAVKLLLAGRPFLRTSTLLDLLNSAL